MYFRMCVEKVTGYLGYMICVILQVISCCGEQLPTNIYSPIDHSAFWDVNLSISICDPHVWFLWFLGCFQTILASAQHFD